MGALVSAPTLWQSAFVATTFALGDEVDDARASLGDSDLALANAMVVGLSHPTRDVRARTLAATLGRIATDIESLRLR